MKRITLEEAKYYITLKEEEVFDYMSKNLITHYSLIPHSDPGMAKKGWEEVIYHINKNDLDKKKNKVRLMRKQYL
jgi:hypothetical protein